jgi:hypothetical protein
MSRKSLLTAAFASAALASVAVAPTASDDDGHGRSRRLRAELSPFNEAPLTLSTPASGRFRAVLNASETEIQYRLDYANLSGDVTQAHIHLGAHHQTGGISVWLCGTAATPTAPAGTPTCGPGGVPGPEAEGTLVASDVVGPTAQGIAPGEFAELVKAVKAGVTYVNVHTTTFAAGEIRGQVKVD